MRLVTFGCSFTYGQGLPDNYDVNKQENLHIPSKFAWPQLLADKLNMECVNTSLPGASNKEILNTLLNFKFDSSDVVIVMWSFVERWCKIKNYTSIDRLAYVSDSNGCDLNVLTQYDKVFTFEDMQLDFIYRANFAKMYLDNKNLKNYHLSVNPYNCCPKVMPVWNTVNFVELDLTMMSRWLLKALDTVYGNPHPGLEAHQNLATGLFEEISNAYNK